MHSSILVPNVLNVDDPSGAHPGGPPPIPLRVERPRRRKVRERLDAVAPTDLAATTALTAALIATAAAATNTAAIATAAAAAAAVPSAPYKITVRVFVGFWGG